MDFTKNITAEECTQWLNDVSYNFVYGQKARDIEYMLSDATGMGARFYHLDMQTFDGQKAEDLLGDLRGLDKFGIMDYNDEFRHIYPKFKVDAFRKDEKNYIRIKGGLSGATFLFDADSLNYPIFSEHKDYYIGSFKEGERWDGEWELRKEMYDINSREYRTMPFDGQEIASVEVDYYSGLGETHGKSRVYNTDCWFQVSCYDKEGEWVARVYLYVPCMIEKHNEELLWDKAIFTKREVKWVVDDCDRSWHREVAERCNRGVKHNSICYTEDRTVNYSLRNASFAKMMIVGACKRYWADSERSDNMTQEEYDALTDKQKDYFDGLSAEARRNTYILTDMFFMGVCPEETIRKYPKEGYAFRKSMYRNLYAFWKLPKWEKENLDKMLNENTKEE